MQLSALNPLKSFSTPHSAPQGTAQSTPQAANDAIELVQPRAGSRLNPLSHVRALTAPKGDVAQAHRVGSGAGWGAGAGFVIVGSLSAFATFVTLAVVFSLRAAADSQAHRSYTHDAIIASVGSIFGGIGAGLVGGSAGAAVGACIGSIAD